jgi:hypothetical protein
MLLSQFPGTRSDANSNTLRTAFLMKLFQEAPLLSALQFYKMTGNLDMLRKGINMTDDLDTRAIDSQYTAKVDSPSWTDSVPLKIIGKEISTDIANERRGGDIGSYRTADLEAYARSLSRSLTDKIINSDGTGLTIKGLKSLIPTDSTIKLGDNGLLLATDGSASAKKAATQFFTTFTAAIERINGGANAIICNYLTKAYLHSIFKESLVTTKVTDGFGNYTEIKSYNNIPIIDAGYKANNTGLIIPQSETVGTSTDCSSIYLFHSEEKIGFTGMTNTGLDVFDKGLIGTQYVTMIDGDMNFNLTDSTMVGKITGLRFDFASI